MLHVVQLAVQRLGIRSARAEAQQLGHLVLRVAIADAFEQAEGSAAGVEVRRIEQLDDAPVAAFEGGIHVARGILLVLLILRIRENLFALGAEESPFR